MRVMTSRGPVLPALLTGLTCLPVLCDAAPAGAPAGASKPAAGRTAPARPTKPTTGTKPAAGAKPAGGAKPAAASPVPAAAPARSHPLLDQARQLVRKGSLAEARELLTSALAREPGPAALGLAEIALRTGDYSEAGKQAQAAEATVAWKAQGVRLRAEALRLSGDWSAAVDALRAAAKGGWLDLRGRVDLALMLLDRGRDAEGTALLDAVIRDFNGARIDRKNAEELCDTARAAVALGLWQDANETFQDALQVDASCLRANLEWGALFLSKYNPDEALKCFTDAAKVDKDNPEVLLARAGAMLERGVVNRLVREEMDAVQKLNPRLSGIQTLRARLALDEENLTGAAELLQGVLKQDGEHLEALSLLAAVRFLQDDAAGYEILRKQALALHPRFGRFFLEVGELAVRNRRYEEAVGVFRQGLAADPKDWRLTAALGLNLLRLGVKHEAEGLQLVRRAFQNDGFNVRTYNTLQLYEEVLLKDYATFDAGPFRIRVSKKERPLLERYVPRLLQKAWDEYCKKYGFTPAGPILVELFIQRQHYGARTLGLPEIGAQGTCFGDLVTAMSPGSAEASWEQVLWHELAHVFHIHLSRSRVARWFTEGLSEYETNIVRPHWKREHAEEIFDLLEEGKLLRIEQLSNGFTEPDSPGGVAVTYQQSSLVIHYLAETFGFPRLVAGLKLYGEGKGDAEVLRQITGKSPTELDEGFRAYVRKKYGFYATQFRFDPTRYREGDKFEAAAKAAPQDARAQAEWSAALVVRRSPEAPAQLRRVLELDPKNVLARYLAAELKLGSGDDRGAASEFEALAADGGDGFPVRRRLGQLALKAGDVAAAQVHLDLAKSMDPDSSEPYQLLMQHYEQKDLRDELLEEAEALLQVEEHNHNVARLLFDRLALDRKWEALLRVAPRVLELTPMEPFIHQQYGVALAQSGRPAEAAFELESALAAGVRRPAVVRGALARQYLAAGDKVRARKAAEETLKEDPKNADAAEVLRRLEP